MHDLEFRENYDEMFTNLVRGGTNYLSRHSGINAVIVGLSGGIDSFVTTALARETINRLGEDVKIVGYSLPIFTNELDETYRAKMTGDLCDTFAEVDLSTFLPPLVNEVDLSLYRQSFVEANMTTKAKIRVGNLKARLRMMYLYDKAQKYNGMVLSTDNFTEWLLGFWTLHGDVGDFGFIQELWKTEVYGLAEHIRDCGIAEDAAEACINAKPTDGLGVSDSDLSQLLPEWTGGYREGYKEVDKTLQHWLVAEERTDEDAAFAQKVLCDHSVIQRHVRTEFKRNNPANLSRHMVLGLM